MLLLLLALQLGWTAPIVLPEGEPITPTRLDPIRISPISAAPAIVRRALFNTGRGEADAGGDAPLDGAVPVGVMMRGGRAVAFVQAPGGGAVALAPGASYHGWTVVRVSASGLVVRRGEETRALSIAASPGTSIPAGTQR